MSIANRFFKTTQGVPFEFIVGKTLVDYATTKLFIENTALYDISAFLIDKIAAQPKGTAWNAAISAANLKLPFFIGVAETLDTASGDMNLFSVTPMNASTIRAELVAYKAPANQVSNITLTAGTISTLQTLVFKIIETTPGNQPLPTWSYDATLTTSAAAQFTKIVNKIALKQEDEFFTAALVAGGIQITSLDPNRHFKLVATVLPTAADQSDYGVVYTMATTVAASSGSGTLAQVQELEREYNVRRGIGHYYTDEISFGTGSNDFGLPVSVAAASGTTTFDIVVLAGTKTESSPTAAGVHIESPHYLYVAVPAGQGSKIVALFA